MNPNTDTDTTDIRAELIGIYTKILAEANEYLDRRAECARLGIVVLAAHCWAVVLDEPACNNAIGYTTDRKYCLKGVRGHLCGTSLFTKADAEMVAADWASKAPPSLKNTRVIYQDDLVLARKADAEAQIAFLTKKV